MFETKTDYQMSCAGHTSKSNKDSLASLPSSVSVTWNVTTFEASMAFSQAVNRLSAGTVVCPLSKKKLYLSAPSHCIQTHRGPSRSCMCTKNFAWLAGGTSPTTAFNRNVLLGPCAGMWRAIDGTCSAGRARRKVDSETRECCPCALRERLRRNATAVCGAASRTMTYEALCEPRPRRRCVPP